MSQYSYHGHAGMPNGAQQQHPPPPQLTSLSNLPTHPYQQNSPGPPPQLPPLHTPGTTSFSSQMYRPAAGPQGMHQQAQQPHQQQNGRVNATPETSHLTSHQEQPYSQFNPQQQQANGSGTGSQQPTSQLPHLSAFSSAPTSQPPSNFSSSTNHANSSLYSSVPYGQPPPHSLPNLSNTSYGTSQRQSPIPSYNTQPQISLPPQDNQAMEARLLPLVGSQGRRGILPSAPGRATPPAAVQDPAPRNNLTVPKNPDGKYPCSYCNKTYQHLKHLKRHILRHTNERPYSCALCQETFCRSDILKRHFQKCQIRRGNPNGLSHLTYAHAHKRPQQQAQQAQQTSQPLQQQQRQQPPQQQQQQQQQQQPPQLPTQHLTQPQPQAPSQFRQDQVPIQPPNLAEVRTPNIGPPSVASSTTSTRPSWHSGQTGYSQTPYGGDSNQLQPNAVAFDSNRSSRSSSIMRPGSANSDDRKRYSGTTSHTSSSTGMGMNTSPGSGLTLNPLQSQDAKPNGFRQSSYRERMAPAGYHDQNEPSSYYHASTMPPASMGTQVESSSNFPYGRQQFPTYNGNHGGAHGNESWNYYAPVAHGDVMFSS